MSHAVRQATTRSQTHEALQPTFTGYDDFVVAYNAARQAAAAVYGERWYLHPQAYIPARLPVAWTRIKVAGRTAPHRLPPRFDPALIGVDQDCLPVRERLPDEVIGERWSEAPRDRKLPVAKFWPGGELPIGPEYESTSNATLKPKKQFSSKLREAQRDQQLHHVSAEQWRTMFPDVMPASPPAKPRRPSGIGLPSGRDRAEGDFYIEPRWLVDALLDVETFAGGICDPLCGAGNIVGACLARGLSATGSDLYDRGFGQQRDAFSISEPFDNLVSNPPFVLIEQVIRHFRPLARHKLVLLARLNILEGQERRELFREHPPARVWVSARRASIPPGHLQHPRDQFGAVVPLPATGGSTAYCWAVWDHDYSGPTTLGWL